MPRRPKDTDPFETHTIDSLEASTDTPRAPHPPRDESDPNPALWLYYLWFRPRRFFSYYIENHSVYLIFICVWFMGIAHAINRMDIQAMKGSPSAALYTSSWTSYAVFALIAGSISALFIYLIGGWWYRTRINWCGDTDADKAIARRVYIYAGQIHVVPAIFTTIIESTYYPTPADAAFGNGSLWYLVLMLFPFWSYYLSYRGVRTVFDVGRKRAITWFLILPSIFTGIAVAVAVVAIFFLHSVMPPDTDNPRTHTSDVTSFRYPGNWTIDFYDVDHDPDYDISIDMPQDGMVRFMIYESDSKPLEEVEVSAAGYESVGFTLTRTRDVTSWGRHKGQGILYHTRYDTTLTHDLLIFATPLSDDLMLEVIEFYPDGDKSLLQPGLDLLRRSLQITPSRIYDPVVDPPSTHSSDSISFEYPSNWYIDTDDADFDPDSNLYIIPPQDGIVHLMRYESEADLESAIAEIAEGIEDNNGFTLTEKRRFSRVGNLSGLGIRYDAQRPEGDYEIRIFMTQLPDGSCLEYRENFMDDDEAAMLPGFDLIRNSLRVKP